MSPALAPVIRLHPGRRPVLLVSIRDAHLADLQAGRLPFENCANTVIALKQLRQHPGKYAAVVLDFDQISPARIPGFVTSLRAIEDAQDLTPTPVMLIWHGHNLVASQLAAQSGICWTHRTIPAGLPLSTSLGDFLSSAVPKSAPAT